MTVLYLSHGAPPLADDALWTRQLAEWAGDLPRPKAILVVSAHWEEAPLTIGATTTVPLVYDFWGFPEHYYQVKYEAPGAPELAAKVGSSCTRPPPRCTTRPIAGSTMARTCHWWRCSPTRTSRCCRSRCRRWTRRCCTRWGASSRRCGTRVC